MVTLGCRSIKSGVIGEVGLAVDKGSGEVMGVTDLTF